MRMTPLEFHRSKVEEESQGFIDDVYKVLAIKGVAQVDKVKLVIYQLKGVSLVRYNQ